MTQLEKIKSLLTSQFELDLFEASVTSLNDNNNKLRFNNFAYSIRELSRHFLHNLAPEKEVQNCVWFKKETENGLSTRKQKVKYAIQGGLDDKQLDKWGYDITNSLLIIKSVVDSINTLSKFTHINQEVFNISDAEVTSKSQEVFKAFIGFIETIETYRDNLKKTIDGHIEEHIIDSVITNYFGNIDQIATQFSLEYSEILDYNVSDINSSEIVVDIFGNLYVTLEYGTRHERRLGDGLDIPHTFPFETKIRYFIDEEIRFDNYEIDDYDVDTDSFYE